MTQTASWFIAEQVLYLPLEGQPTLEELEMFNKTVTDMLNTRRTKVSILIDATHLQASYQTAEYLRHTQKYMNHPQLDSAFVVADNKLNRLVTLMAFGVSRTQFVQFDSMSRAKNSLQRRGYNINS